jgi:hypothetical protein
MHCKLGGYKNTADESFFGMDIAILLERVTARSPENKSPAPSATDPKKTRVL